jgi:hypothetical protein
MATALLSHQGGPVDRSELLALYSSLSAQRSFNDPFRRSAPVAVAIDVDESDCFMAALIYIRYFALRCFQLGPVPGVLPAGYDGRLLLAGCQKQACRCLVVGGSPRSCSYAGWSWRYVPLLLSSVGFNVVCALLIARSRQRPRAGMALVAARHRCKPLLLGYFKYATS